jgi:hypothetical protein
MKATQERRMLKNCASHGRVCVHVCVCDRERVSVYVCVREREYYAGEEDAEELPVTVVNRKKKKHAGEKGTQGKRMLKN